MRHCFKKGNQFWKMRSSQGPKPKFDDPEILWAACEEYFDWVESNPLQQPKIFNVKGTLVRENLERMRAMTIHGLCIFLDLSYPTWMRYRKRFPEITSRAEAVIRTQKFEGAAAYLLNSNIIKTDLKLGERNAEADDEHERDRVDADIVTRKLLHGTAGGGEEGKA